jgi:acyl-CoA synthetase (NDP forming)
LLEAAVTRGLGLSAFVSIGNKADVSSNDLLEWWEDDDATEAILLYLESFGNPRRFGRLARRVARRKPILALKSGTSVSGQRAASSHTAALAGSEAAVDALFRQAGVIRATSLEELIDVATLFSSTPKLAGRNVALMTNAGGLGILCADACEAAGLELAPLGDETLTVLRAALPAEASVANPVDMLGGATAETYATVVPALLADPHIDALMVLFVPAVSATAEDVADAVEQATATAGSEKPVLGVVISADGVPAAFRAGNRHVASFAYPESAAHALGRAAERAEWLRRPLGSIPDIEGIDRHRAEAVAARVLAAADESWLEPADVRELLLAYGMPLVAERVAQTAGEAVDAACELGLPVVVKTAEPGAHKTELGGIALDLNEPDAVRDAAERIGGPVLVQPMVKGGAELLAGVVQDPVFGPLVAFGPGGVLAELIGEASFRIAPLTDADAEELVSTGKAGRLVVGFRGAPPGDRAALEDLLHRLSRLGEDLPSIAELDLNPVLALPDRCVVVDARVSVRRPAAGPRVKTW